MMCEGGCINGAGTIIQASRAKGTFVKINGGSSKKTILSNNLLEVFQKLNLEK